MTGTGASPHPLFHRRTWRYDTVSAALTVSDELLCSGAHTAEIFWHFALECRVDCEDGRGNTLPESRLQIRRPPR